MAAATEARLFRRLQAVRRIAEGYSVTDAAKLAGVDRTSVHRWVQQYLVAHRVEDLDDAPRWGRPRAAEQLTEAWLAEVRAREPRQEGYQAMRWEQETGPGARALWTEIRRRYRAAPTIW
jgi:transposase